MKKVLLTGISGYIGLHCAAELLKNGYAVKGSLRSTRKADGIRETLSSNGCSTEHLEFCELDLLKEEGWAEAAEGCDFLMHVASPYFSKVPKDENKLIKPAVQGTLSAMKAAHKAGLKRVVLTSSLVAMMGDINGVENVTEATWTNVNAKDATPYVKSKTLAEQAAWKYAKENDMELVTVHPGPVYGPPLDDNLSGESMSVFTRVLKGQVPMMIKGSMNMSDVRDIAKIHVQALENEKAAGHRFIVTTEKPHDFVDMQKVLKANGYKVSDKLAPTFVVRMMSVINSEMKGMLPFAGKDYKADVSATMSTFNWKPIALEKTALDTAEKVSKIIT